MPVSRALCELRALQVGRVHYRASCGIARSLRLAHSLADHLSNGVAGHARIGLASGVCQESLEVLARSAAEQELVFLREPEGVAQGCIDVRLQPTSIGDHLPGCPDTSGNHTREALGQQEVHIPERL